MPGVGPLIASAMVAAIGNGAAFIKSRDFAGGWVWCRSKFRPATGRSFGGISRSRYLRTLFVQGACRSFPAQELDEIWLRSLAYGWGAATT